MQRQSSNPCRPSHARVEKLEAYKKRMAWTLTWVSVGDGDFNPRRYRENCVGFTHRLVDWEEAKASIRQVWKVLPDMRVELHNVLATGDVAVVQGRSHDQHHGATASCWDASVRCRRTRQGRPGPPV